MYIQSFIFQTEIILGMSQVPKVFQLTFGSVFCVLCIAVLMQKSHAAGIMGHPHWCGPTKAAPSAKLCVNVSLGDTGLPPPEGAALVPL